jgi:hypothetical protein
MFTKRWNARSAGGGVDGRATTQAAGGEASARATVLPARAQWSAVRQARTAATLLALAVHLVRAHVDEQLDACGLGGLQQHVGAQHIGLRELERVPKGVV